MTEDKSDITADEVRAAKEPDAVEPPASPKVPALNDDALLKLKRSDSIPWDLIIRESCE